MRHYDLCVIGSGPAGQKAAIQAAKLGKRVCVVEREVIGGVAINTGTIPSKALREAILRAIGRATPIPGLGDFRDASGQVTLPKLLEATQSVIRAEVEVVRSHLTKNGIDTIQGVGQFADPHTINVVKEHSVESVHADYIVIATGTRPAKAPGIEFDGEDIITSDELLHLDVLPHSMIVVGGA